MLSKKSEQSPREVILVRSVCATDLTFVEKWSNILLTVTFTICCIVFVALMIAILFMPDEQSQKSFEAEMKRLNAEVERLNERNSHMRPVGVTYNFGGGDSCWETNDSLPSSPVQSTEDFRGGDLNFQVDGNYLGGPDRPDVRVGEDRGAGELQP
ncbi:MAG: hypothetical protein J6S75_14010 [Thermoguttaceae bacterium]|nr:hypothetical protein [Thermoguttaceae bacterium]